MHLSAGLSNVAGGSPHIELGKSLNAHPERIGVKRPVSGQIRDRNLVPKARNDKANVGRLNTLAIAAWREAVQY